MIAMTLAPRRFSRPLSRRAVLPALALAALAVAGCTPQSSYQASKKSAVELRTIQTRTIPVGQDEAMRAVIETMHDLGYRITRVSPEAGTVAGARSAALRMAVVVQPHGDGAESAVRANASVISPRLEAQVDSAAFYQRDFFEPLGQTLGRTPAAIAAEDAGPEAPQTVAELNTIAAREAKAKAGAAAKTE